VRSKSRYTRPLANAVIHGNHENPDKRVYLTRRCSRREQRSSGSPSAIVSMALPHPYAFVPHDNQSFPIHTAGCSVPRGPRASMDTMA
jgi:hypothetical protein